MCVFYKIVIKKQILKFAHMKQYHTDIVYYSPTGTSKRVAMAFAEGLDKAGASFPGTRQTDLTTDFSEDPVPLGDSLVVAAAPVYGGRLAETAAKRFSRLKGSGTPAVAIVLYGNRDYEDALAELQDLLEDAGFKVVAAAAFIGEHSYSRPAMPVAEGRPDSADIASAVKFGEDVAAKLSSCPACGHLYVRGNRPYKTKGQHVPQAPVCDSNLCTGCGICESSCPVGAVKVLSGVAVADSGQCTKCCACVKGCPSGALSFDTPFTEYLYRNFSGRKEPEIFL